MVHHLSRMTDKERRHVCTGDEQRKSPVDKVGIHGDLWSEVRNRHSRHIYLILTQPALGSDTWVTQIFSHSTQFSGKAYHCSSKASRREHLQVEEPVACWDCS